jgi:uncharacterized protein (TIGR03067 family)
MPPALYLVEADPITAKRRPNMGQSARKIRALLIVAASLLIGADAKEDDVIKKEKAKLKGSWKAVSAEHDGAKIPDELLKNVALTIRDDKVLKKGRDWEATYKIDPKQKPAWLDMVPIVAEDGKGDGKRDTTVRWIYEVDGDTLKICGSESGGADRPKEFATKRGDQRVLIVFKREEM